MTEHSDKKFYRENNLLEYWRKRYLGQACIVVFLAVVLVLSVFFGTKSHNGGIIVFLLSIVVVYLMLKELRASLQTRGEKIFWERADKLYPAVVFDYGKRCENENVPVEFEDYKVCESYNSMSGEKYTIEEKWLYSLFALGPFPITQTAFDGIKISFRQPVNEGKLGQAEQKIKKIFKAKKIIRQKEDNCLWIPTEKKVFYRLSLVQKNEFAYFVERVELLKKIMDEISE